MADKGANAMSTAAAVVRSDGVLGLWRGWWPATVRVLPATVLVFPAMEALRSYVGLGSY